MKERKTLTEQDFPMRMNIHFRLGGNLRAEVLTLNKVLVTRGSEVDFSKQHIPHITILMGTINSFKDYKYIVEVISKTAVKINGQQIAISRPYIVTPLKKFVFLDITPKNKIKKIKYKFFNALEQYMKLDYYGRPNSHIHLTLGYIEEISSGTEKLIHKMNLMDSLSIVSQIAISPVSLKGTCLKETYIIDIPGRN